MNQRAFKLSPHSNPQSPNFLERTSSLPPLLSMNRKPPLPVSPRRLRPRRPPTSRLSIQTPTAKTASKPPTLFHLRHSIAGEIPLRHEYPIYAPESAAVAKKSMDDSAANAVPITKPLFQRGRLYEAYSALRNERLKRKMMEISEKTVSHYPEKSAEPSKKRVMKKEETLRKSVPANFSVSRTRSALRPPSVRRSNEVKKLLFSELSGFSSIDVGKKMMTRSAQRKVI
ncbi:hypothetical protein KSP39_PZI008438 [Platanthera zijinensis]|uniref:Uncharacterized protein n=1 Tax=Platanthera zijinensis TaxID=2320716 RepID=A0AAP0BP55_9ASPA